MDALGVDSASKIKPQEQGAPETFRIPVSLSDDGPEQVADFGSLHFAHGSRHVRPFLRVALPETDMKRVVGFLLEHWRISRPTGPILTVMGGGRDFEVSEEVMAFLRALPGACSATGAWVFTGGSDTGVMKIVGQVFRDARSAVPLIGVFPWGACNGREDLVGQRGGTAFYNRKLPTDDGAPLNGDHTHFLLVDNGTVGSVAWGSELHFRAALEKELAALTSTVIQVVIQGGPVTLQTVAKAAVPTIVLIDTGGAATAIGEFLAGGIDKVTEEMFKKLADELEAIKAADDEAANRGSQLVYMFGSKNKDGLVQTMRRALGNSTQVTLDARVGGHGGPSATLTEVNHVGLALLSAVDWNQPEDVKRLMTQCSKEWVLKAFHLARKKVRDGPVARA